MWEIKSKEVKRLTQAELEAHNKANPNNPLPIGRLLQLQLTMTFTDGSQDITVSTWISNKDEVRQTIKQNEARLNEQAELEKELADDTFEVEPTTPQKSQEEIEAEEAQKAKAEWQNKRQALKQMREDMVEAKDLGVEPTTEQIATMKALAEWVRDNASEEFYS